MNGKQTRNTEPKSSDKYYNRINFQTQIHLTNVCEKRNDLSSRND